MVLSKNKTIIGMVGLIIIAFWVVWFFSNTGEVYGSEENIVVKCDYKGDKIFFEGKLGDWNNYTKGSQTLSGAKLKGTVFNVIGALMRSDIGECEGDDIQIQTGFLYWLSSTNELKPGNVSCPFSGYISFFKIIDDEDSTDEGKYVLVPTRCADPNNPYELLTGKGITEGSVLFKVDDVKPLALSYDGSSLMEGEDKTSGKISVS